MFTSFVTFISVFLFLCVAVVWFVCWVVARVCRHRMPFAPFAYTGLAIVAIFWAVMFYGYRFGRFQLRVQHSTYTSDKVPAAFDGYKIVHISDLHFSSLADSPAFLQRVIDTINAQHPDLICFTGDFVGFGVEEAMPFTNMLRQLQATDGVTSVFGNHDFALYHHGLSSKQKEEKVEQLAIYQRDTLGWKLLRNHSVVIIRDSDALQIIGVDNASCQGQGFQTVYRADLPKSMLLQAEANAKIAIAKAEGEARAMKIKADAEAYYNRTISASLTHNIVLEDWIEKWDGKMPQIQGNSNMMPMINFSK